MSSLTDLRAPDLVASIGREGFAFVHGDAMRALLSASGTFTDWESFVASWDGFELDTYMADGGRYRRRRHAVFAARAGFGHRAAAASASLSDARIQPAPRRRRPMVRADRARGRRRRDASDRPRVLPPSVRNAGRTAPRPWRIEVHQFRIEARGGEAGRPTPEGLHRDGVDYVLVLLVNRRNIASGTTSIHALDGRTLGQFTLTDPFDAALVDDSRVAHGVTPVEAIDSSQPAYRDVLVVTFKADSAA